MIISYRYKFIFIRTRKTASSTIEELLKEGLGPDDLIVAQNALRNNRTNLVVTMPDQQPGRIAGHMKAEAIANLVPKSFWNECFKFTSERHPYEKAVSLAYFNFGKRESKGKQQDMPFSEYLDRIVRKGKYRSFDQYSIDGKVVANDFVRHETLHADLLRIGSQLGIAVPDELPQRKTAFRQEARP